MRRIRHDLLRPAAATLISLLAVPVGVVVLALVALQVQPVRDAVLRDALQRLEPSLPGTLRIERPRWPELDRLALGGVLWTAGPDTLIAADTLAVDVDLLPLLSRDVSLETLRARIGSLDLPALRAAMHGGGAAADTTGGAAGPTSGSGSPFPRAGAFGLPSVRVGDLAVAVGRLTLPDSTLLTGVDLEGSLDLLPGGPGRVDVTALRAAAPRAGWRVERTELRLELASGRVGGESHGRLAAGWPYHLRLATAAEDSFEIVLSRRADAEPPGAVGLRLRTRLEREDLHLRGATVDLLLRAPDVAELRTAPGLGGRLGGLPDLAGVTAELRGRVRLGDRRSARGVLTLRPNAWLEGARVAAAWRPGSLEVDTLAVRLQGLALAGDLALADSVLTTRLEARLDGWEWLRRLRPAAAPAGSLSARLGLAARVPLAAGRPALVSVGVAARGLALSTAAQVRRGRTLTARLAPLRLAVADTPSVPPLDTSPRRGLVERAPDGTLRVEDLSIEGAAGDLTLSGLLVPGARAEIHLDAAWPVPPELLVDRLRLPPARVAALREGWAGAEPYALRADGTATLGQGRELSLGGTLRLPGPGALAPLLPDGARLEDLGPIEGDFSASAAPAGEGTEYRGRLDLGRTAWLRRGLLRLRGEPGALVVDTLDVAMPGVEIAGHVGRRDGSWRGRLVADLTAAGLPRRLLPQLGDEASADLRIAADVAGTVAAPEVTADLSGSLDLPQATVPTLSGRARLAAGRLGAIVRAPDGVIAGGIALDSLVVAVGGSAPGAPAGADTAGAGAGGARGAAGPWPLSVRLQAASEKLSLAQALLVDRLRPDGWRVRCDSLDLSLDGGGLRTAAPFTVLLRPAAERVEVDGLRLDGSLGRLSADGHLARGGSDFTSEMDLTLPEEPMLPSLDRRLWPSTLKLTLAARGSDSLEVDLAAGGLRVGEVSRFDAHLQVHGGGGDIVARLDLSDQKEALLTARAELPGSLRAFPFDFSLSRGTIGLDARLESFPLPLGMARYGPGAAYAHPLLLAGRVLVRGTAARPQAYADLSATFPDWPKLSGHTVRLEIESAAGDSLDAALSRAGVDRRLLKREGLTGAGQDEVVAALQVDRGGTELLHGRLRHPLRWSLRPAAVEIDRQGDLELVLDSQALALTELDPLLPPDVNLQGRAEVHLKASGPVSNPRLDGRLAARKAQLGLAHGTRVTADGDLTLSGTQQSPRVKGKITIVQGSIQIPEQGRELLPLEGEPRLWRAGLVRPTSPEAEAAAASPAPPDTVPAVPKLDLDVTLDIPSGLWIRGRGLEVELAGSLRLVQQGGGGLPTITGSLQAIRGTFHIIGRSFSVSHGQVTFYGGDELDPSLDLLLTAQVADVTIEVTFGGTLQKPELTLSSQPDMSEGDIMSYLVFGRPVDELSGDQMSLVQTRASEMVTAFGATQLAGELSGQLGVDLLAIQQGQGQNGTSVVIGKYLSPRLLVKYEQVLDQTQSFFVNLEYMISSHFRLDTLLGQQQQSGLELNWTSDY